MTKLDNALITLTVSLGLFAVDGAVSFVCWLVAAGLAVVHNVLNEGK